MKLLLFALLLLLVACDHLPPAVRDHVRPPKPAPIAAEVICDAGGGSSGCTAAHLDAVLRELTPSLPAGSIVRLHGMADAVADGKQLATFTVTAPKKKTLKALRRHQREQTERVVREFTTAAAPLLRIDDRRRSPIAETIGRALLATTPRDAERHLYLLTDAREVSKNATLGPLDFECGTILPPDEFAQRLRTLYPSLRGITIHFRYVELEPVANDRCTATVERYTQLKSTWTGALQAQGAAVTWQTN